MKREEFYRDVRILTQSVTPKVQCEQDKERDLILRANQTIPKGIARMPGRVWLVDKN